MESPVWVNRRVQTFTTVHMHGKSLVKCSLERKSKVIFVGGRKNRDYGHFRRISVLSKNRAQVDHSEKYIIGLLYTT